MRTSRWITRPSLWRLALALAAVVGNGRSSVQADDTGQQCERLKATSTYTQEEAPRDLSGLLPVVVEKVNKALDGVVDVEVEWTGADLHGRVGEHIVQCKVARLVSAVTHGSENDEVVVSHTTEDGREVTTQCFHVPFTILDTNECLLPAHHHMRHQCQEPSMCVNTVGSYECVCPRLGASSRSVSGTADIDFWNALANEDRSLWEISFQSASRTSCPGHSSTHECCPAKAHTPDGTSCRRRFACPVDPCASGQTNDCASEANCVLKDSPMAVPNYECVCPEGLMGNGHTCTSLDPKPEPKVMFDGVTPTELTVKNNYYCGCTKPVIDACSGFPPCKGKHEICVATSNNTPTCGCKPGYVMHETYGCVDVSPPVLRLRHDPNNDRTLRLKQGDEYREYMVDIVDENAEDYLRSLKITYSKPLPPGCLTQVGEFHVNYTVATPWTTPSSVQITRRVIIEDIDECNINHEKYKTACPSLIPQCDTAAGATCVNTIGSYACQCPPYSSGDGFVETATFVNSSVQPEGYQGGTSCTDTSKPVITLKGPNPKIFKTCQCGGLSGVLTGKLTNDEDRQMQSDQRRLYEDDIKEMIKASSGAELCATYDGNARPSATDCVKAVDHTYKGDVDLSDRVVVGEPVQKSPLHWVVPYDVTDDAGNRAKTAWRDVTVEEVDLVGVEAKIRQDVTREQQAENKKVVEKAVREEKMKWERKLANEQRQAATASSRRSGGNSRRSCPPCPECDCGMKEEANQSNCQKFCSSDGAQICTWSDDGLSYAIIAWLETTFSPPIALIILVVALGGLAFVALGWVYYFLFSPKAYKTYYYQAAGNTPDEDIMYDAQPTTSSVPATPFTPRQASQQPGSTPRHSVTEQQQPTMNGMNGFGSQATMFSPAQQIGSPLFQQNGGAAARRRDNGDSASFYSPTPSIISPSKTGDGVRRGPY